jgi:hypothetical protein
MKFRSLFIFIIFILLLESSTIIEHAYKSLDQFIKTGRVSVMGVVLGGVFGRSKK